MNENKTLFYTGIKPGVQLPPLSSPRAFCTPSKDPICHTPAMGDHLWRVLFGLHTNFTKSFNGVSLGATKDTDAFFVTCAPGASFSPGAFFFTGE